MSLHYMIDKDSNDREEKPPEKPKSKRCDKWVVAEGNLPRHLCILKANHKGRCK